MRDVPLVLEIRRLRSPEEAEACAALMAGSEPWITLGRTYDEALALMTGAECEVHRYPNGVGAARAMTSVGARGDHPCGRGRSKAAWGQRVKRR